jgi:hypothetical protein
MSRTSWAIVLAAAFAACAPTVPAAPPADAKDMNAPALALACDGTPVKAGAKDYCVVKTRRNFGDAAKDCDRMRGRLAVIDDAPKSGALAKVLASPWGYGSGMWLGCSDADKEGAWTCDGKPMAYASWAPGQPDNQLALDDCAEWLADSGQWNDAACDQKLGFVCKGDDKLACTGKRVTAGGAVFCARGDAPADWDGAKKACADAGGKLAVVANADEGRALFDALKLPSGVPSYEPGEGVWIGLTDAAQEGAFRWTSDTPATFTNWAAGQPNDTGGGEDCATLTLGDGKWNDVDCAKMLPYVCEVK